ncbi:hypothetical protein FB451DRAFT_1189166 [Mycena latifolia]|nr:hypothetical protein FB451DRAFT_1189166 [Mycena latifolia]
MGVVRTTFCELRDPVRVRCASLQDRRQYLNLPRVLTTQVNENSRMSGQGTHGIHYISHCPSYRSVLVWCQYRRPSTSKGTRTAQQDAVQYMTKCTVSCSDWHDGKKSRRNKELAMRTCTETKRRTLPLCTVCTEPRVTTALVNAERGKRTCTYYSQFVSTGLYGSTNRSHLCREHIPTCDRARNDRDVRLDNKAMQYVQFSTSSVWQGFKPGAELLLEAEELDLAASSSSYSEGAIWTHSARKARSEGAPMM